MEILTETGIAAAVQGSHSGCWLGDPGGAGLKQECCFQAL